MKKIIDKINIEKILIIFLLFQPIIDLITSLSVRFLSNFTTLGVIIKGMFLLFLLIYILIKYKFKDRKISTIFLIIFILYEMIYLLLNITLKSNIVLMSEIKNSIKTFFIPISITCLYDIFKNEKFKINSRYFAYILIEYVILILIASITGTAFKTYLGDKIGTIGWFYAGNDISVILISLFPILYYCSVKNFNIVFILSCIISIFAILEIGTKVSSFGLVLIYILMMILSIINYIIKRNKINYKKEITILLLLGIFISFLLPKMPIVSNLKMQYDNKYQSVNLDPDTDDADLIDDMIFSGRTKFKNASLKRYKNANIALKLFGLGYVDKNNNEYKLVERDHYDILFNHGIIGFIMIYFTIFYITFLILKKIFSKSIKEIFRLDIEIYLFIPILMFIISLYSGHVLLNPAVGIYFSFIIINLYFKINNTFNKMANKKITVMALHLKPGGIERFISTTTKFLSKKYDIEIVSVYEYDKNEIVDIPKNIKVKYLLPKECKPNKEIIKKYLNEKRYLLVIKELFIALKIIILKNTKMIKYIKKCNSDIIISTRSEHNLILSEYSKPFILKIATEHNYYSKKYSRKVVNSCNNIDYFVVSTDDQKNYYEELFLNSKTKVIKIPFALEDIPKKESKLNNYNLISVGRLSKEKGFDDMINIFSKLLKQNPKFKLKIIGYGNEEGNLYNQIKKLKLEDKIILCGRKTSEEIQEELLNSSFFLLTSHTESFGIVLIEAMSCGVPCIIFDSAKGALEIVKNEYNGFVIKSRDEDKYVNTILNVFKDKSKLQKLGINAKRKSNEFDIKKIEKQWLNLLEK